MGTVRSERAQGLLEFALVLPVLLIILSGLLDLGRLFYAYVAVTDAAGEGANYASIYPDDEANILARAQDASGGLVVIDPDLVTIEAPSVQSGAPVTVTVEYPFTLWTPFLNAIVPDGTLTLRAAATGVILTGSWSN